MFYCFYSGHGVMDTMTKICLSNPPNFNYEIEKNLDKLRKLCTKMFVYSTLDCCRVKETKAPKIKYE